MSKNPPSTKPTPPTKPAAAPSAPATPPYAPLNWAFPFTPADNADAADPMTYMKALAAAEDGFYPLGANGMWHGGIHFGQGTGAKLKQGDGVRAIADGEVVAYRLDSKYPEQDYQDGRHALYSTGFVLIRHRLQLPPPKQNPAKNSGTEPAASTSKPAPNETLTFFSLYMHTMDHNSYQSAAEQAKVAQADSAKLNIGPMPYWEGDRYYRVGEKAKDKQEVPRPKAPVPPRRNAADSDPLGDLIRNNFEPPPTDEEPQNATPLPPPVNEASEQNLRTLLTGIKTLYIDPSNTCNVPHIAYMLATSRVESYDFHKGIFFGPIREGISEAKAEIDYGCGPTARRPEVAKANGNTSVGDDYKYRGRGLVQITWKKMYGEFAGRLKLPLVENPDIALEWGTAFKIMVIGMRDGVFTGSSLSDYLNSSKKDYIGARHIINGSDKTRIFAEYAEKFEKLINDTRS
ncbi:hypothetical protein DIE15_29275 [Burkholderia sp. Bp9031]|nr:hypothetical protein DIE15_29275 [Burkholderia sp. Bp9031]